LLVRKVGAAAVGLAAKLDDLSTVYEASAVGGNAFPYEGYCPTGLVTLASALKAARPRCVPLHHPRRSLRRRRQTV
jgi:hypothetical protein